MGSHALAVRRVDRDLAAIGALTQAVLDGDDLEQLLGRVAHEARRLVEAISGVVVTVAGTPGLMSFRAVDGLSVGPLRVGHVMPVRDTLTELALIRGTNIVARNADEIPAVGRAFATATGTGPLIAAPLASIGTARGVLVVARAAVAPPFTSADVTLVSTFAAQAASAIELFELRASEQALAAATERHRIAGDLHDGVSGALRDLQAGVAGLSVGSDDTNLVAGIAGAVAQLDAAIMTVGEYVSELRGRPATRAAAVADGKRAQPDIQRQVPAALATKTGRPAGNRTDQTIAILGELARATVTDAPSDDILHSLVEAVLLRSDAAFSLVGMVVPDGTEVRVRARAGLDLPGRQVGDLVPIGATVVGQAITLGRPVVREALEPAPAASTRPRQRIGAHVVVPLTVRGRSFGAMAIGRNAGAPAFSESDVRLIEAYGVQASIVLEFERVRAGVRIGMIGSERERIGRDLHERVVQHLFGAAFALQALESTVRDPVVQASLQAAIDGLDRAIRDLRRFVFGLGAGPGSVGRTDTRLEALAADNARLQAEIEAQLLEVRASRRRIIAAGDAERKRVERDLHDGAQQRLVSLTLALRLARARLGDDGDASARRSLDQAAAEAKAALAELRELARGIHPQVLTQAGLRPAVEALASRSPIDVVVEVEERRYSPIVEGAMYFVISEALANVAKYSQARNAVVRADSTLDVLTIEVTDDGIGGADPSSGTGLRGLMDRLEAINGSLDILSPIGGGTRLVARIPVAGAT